MVNVHNTYKKCYCGNRIELWVPLWMVTVVGDSCHHGGGETETSENMDCNWTPLWMLLILL